MADCVPIDTNPLLIWENDIITKCLLCTGIVKKNMQAAWTLEGVVLPSNKKKTRSILSKRMR